ncbi:MAG: redoxin domain-containing protein [Candidatus Poribacteria bacterium]|nr:redoxin domain-containing protein [Candidatus Poribacteria bacterium]
MQKGCVCLTLLVIVFSLGVIPPNCTFSEQGEDSVDVWDVFSNLHHNDRGKLETYWASVPEFQEALTVYLKATIDAGVVNGETSLPPNLVWYEFVGSFPKALREDLYEHAQDILESNPDNGAAAKFAAIVLAGTAWDIPQDGFWDVVEKAMVLLPNDVEVCYLAFEKTGFDYLHEEAVTALERLFERHQEHQAPTVTSPFQRNVQENGKPAFSQWVYRFCYDYQYVTSRPNDFYQRLEGDHPLRERWTAVLGKIQLVFEEQIKLAPDEWMHTRMLAEIHEVLGNTEEAQAVFQRFQLVLKDRLKQNPDDRNAWYGLANLHKKLGNSELAHAYRVNADPPLAWVGKVLPDFSSAVDLDGKPISLADYRGKVVLLDFWTTSYNRIPTLGVVYEKYHHRGFDIIGINLDVDERLLREFIAENPLPWRQIFDGDRYEGPLVKQYGVRSIPRMFLLDRGGKVISVNVRDRSLDKLVAKQLAVETN